MAKYLLEKPESKYFEQFTKMQSTILPDVQPINREKYKSLVEDGKIILAVEETSDDLAGFIIFTNDGDEGYLRQLAVGLNHRRQGLAKRLVGVAHDWFKKQGLDRVKVLVKSENIPALKLYQKFDYFIDNRLYQYILDLISFNHGSVVESIRHLQEEEDRLVQQVFGIAMETLKNYRQLESSISLGKFSGDDLTGFARLRPEFPVLTPIHLVHKEDFPDLLQTVKHKFRSDQYNHLRITKECKSGDYYHNFMEEHENFTLNYILVKMVKKIE